MMTAVPEPQTDVVSGTDMTAYHTTVVQAPGHTERPPTNLNRQRSAKDGSGAEMHVWMVTVSGRAWRKNCHRGKRLAFEAAPSV